MRKGELIPGKTNNL